MTVKLYIRIDYKSINRLIEKNKIYRNDIIINFDNYAVVAVLLLLLLLLLFWLRHFLLNSHSSHTHPKKKQYNTGTLMSGSIAMIEKMK